jgi:hypothetical protein
VVSVVSPLGLDRREVVAVLERAAVVEPIDSFSHGGLEMSNPFSTVVGA